MYLYFLKIPFSKNNIQRPKVGVKTCLVSKKQNKNLHQSEL